MWRIDPGTGTRTLISSFALDTGAYNFFDVDAGGQRAYVVSGGPMGQKTIYTFDSSSGAILGTAPVISPMNFAVADTTTPEPGNGFLVLVALASLGALHFKRYLVQRS